jgi:hypothetical protein
VSDTTSGASRGLEIAANVIGVLGGVGTNASGAFEFVARPADYQAGSVEVLKAANDTIVAKMVSLR